MGFCSLYIVELPIGYQEHSLKLQVIQVEQCVSGNKTSRSFNNVEYNL